MPTGGRYREDRRGFVRTGGMPPGVLQFAETASPRRFAETWTTPAHSPAERLGGVGVASLAPPPRRRVGFVRVGVTRLKS